MTSKTNRDGTPCKDAGITEDAISTPVSKNR